jgi:hypothetical protein
MEETLAMSPPEIDEETAKWMFRVALDGVTYLHLHGDLDDANHYEWLVEVWATSVAFGMLASSDEAFPEEFLRELSGGRAPREDDFLLDVAAEASRLYARWVADPPRLSDSSLGELR